MDIEFIPKMRQGKDRLSLFDKIVIKIEQSIKTKEKAYIEDMSLEDKIENLFTAILPEIPKTRKDIDNAIDTFIKKMNVNKDNGEELLGYLDFYDIGEDIIDLHLLNPSKYLRERIKFKEEGEDTIILSSTKEIVNIVKEYLQSLTPQDLYSLNIFGLVVTQEDANSYKEFYIKQAGDWYIDKLYCYAEESNNKNIVTDTEEDILYKAGERDYKIYLNFTDTFASHLKDKTDQENIEDFKERIRKAITDYPEEAIAYCRALKMIRSNYSERAILSTIDKILNNGNTTD